MSNSLDWSPVDDFGQTEAKLDPFTFIVWQGKEYAELRLIRRDNVGGVIAPISDFSVYAETREQAESLAEIIANALSLVVPYNTFKPLYE